MNKKILGFTMLFVMFMSVTIYAASGYYGKSLSITNATKGYSSTGSNSTGTARVDVNTLSDTYGYKKVYCYIVNSNGTLTNSHAMSAQNTKFFNVNTGNIKAYFKRYGSGKGTTRIEYNFVYNY